MRAGPLVVLVTLVSCEAAPVFAQETDAPPSSGSTAAEDLFRRGRAAAAAGDFATACERFVASEKLEPAPGTLLNIADCELHLGALLAAAEHFRLAASGFPKNDARREFVAGREADIERRLAHITVHWAPTLPDEAQVTRDGETFDRRLVDSRLPANPRPTTFTVSAPGFVDRTFRVPLTDGKSAEITLDVGQPGSNPTATGGGADAKPVPWRTVGFVAGGVGLTSLAVGGITGALALYEASVVKSHCQIPAYTCDAQGVSAGSSGQALAVTSTAAFVIGAALATTGLALVLVNGKPKTERATLAVVPIVGASSGGALTTVSF